MALIRFVRNHSPYWKQDQAAFPKVEAEVLVNSGIAVYYNPEPTPKEPKASKAPKVKPDQQS